MPSKRVAHAVTENGYEASSTLGHCEKRVKHRGMDETSGGVAVCVEAADLSHGRAESIRALWPSLVCCRLLQSSYVAARHHHRLVGQRPRGPH